MRGRVGLGKTRLATALGYAACLAGFSVRFVTAVEVIKTLAAARRGGRLKQALDCFRKPGRLILDELGYLAIDKTGAELLFRIMSNRNEYGRRSRSGRGRAPACSSSKAGSAMRSPPRRW